MNQGLLAVRQERFKTHFIFIKDFFLFKVKIVGMAF